MRIIYPPTIRYDYLYQRPHQLMNALAEFTDANVYFVDAFPLQKGFVEKTSLNVVPHNYKFPKTDELTILWITFPPVAKEMIEKYNPDFVVFDIIDAPIGEFQHWENNWDFIFCRADIVFTSSYELYRFAHVKREQKFVSGGEPMISMLNNACDFRHFKPVRNFTMVNERPVIGFVGALASWLDWDLLYNLVKERPQYDFKFVGPVYNKCGIDRLLLFKNVEFIGHVDYVDVPEQMKNMDVLIMPFDLKDPVSNAVNPVKMYEYCATGLPIVSTAIHEASSRSDIITISDYDNFPDAIDSCLINKKEGQSKRLNFAMLNSWEERAVNAFSLIELNTRNIPNV